MKKAAVYLLIGGIVGLAIPYVVTSDRLGSAEPGADGAQADQVRSILERLDTLEKQLADEVQHRRELRARVESLVADDGGRILPEEGSGPPGESESDEEAGDDEELAPLSRRERRLSRLQEAGFGADEAARIVNIEQEMRLEQLHNRWERRRREYLESPESYDVAADDPMRQELGEEAYERYLEANGRSTHVRVGWVYEGSPAAAAGFQPGDEIVRYDGQRVFNLGDLNAVSVQGSQGSPVLVDVVRNGARLQLAIERGPLGIRVRRSRWRGRF